MFSKLLWIKLTHQASLETSIIMPLHVRVSIPLQITSIQHLSRQ